MEKLTQQLKSFLPSSLRQWLIIVTVLVVGIIAGSMLSAKETENLSSLGEQMTTGETVDEEQDQDQLTSVFTIEEITSYEECVAAGFIVKDSYPEECEAEDGETFTRVISSQEADLVSSGQIEVADEVAQEVAQQSIDSDGPVVGLNNFATGPGGKITVVSAQLRTKKSLKNHNIGYGSEYIEIPIKLKNTTSETLTYNEGDFRLFKNNAEIEKIVASTNAGSLYARSILPGGTFETKLLAIFNHSRTEQEDVTDFALYWEHGLGDSRTAVSGDGIQIDLNQSYIQ